MQTSSNQRRWARWFTLALFTFCLAPLAHAQVVRNFTPRFSTNANGNITFVANALTTCQSSANGCTAAQNATASLGQSQNNDFNIINIDVDGVGGTFNSSSSQLNLPASANVVWAGLYWSAGIDGLTSGQIADRYDILFDTPATPGFSYQTISATQEDDDGYSYLGFAEVTSLVQAAGNGAYTVANVQVDTGDRNRFAGWTLIVVFEDPNEPLRNLTVFDGSAQVSSNTPTTSFTADGFTTPFTGSFDTFLGVVATDGDLGFTGDRFVANGTDLQDIRGTTNDFFNSSITLPGSSSPNQFNNNRNPAFNNTLGYDADILELPSSIVSNGDTSVDFEVTTGGESISLHAVTFAIDIYRPLVTVDKQVTDLNGGQAEAGDILEYDIVVTNTGVDDAIDMVLTDAIPANTTYVPNSLIVSAGPNVGAKSDAADGDQAEYDAGADAVTFRIGTGADATDGGTLVQTATTTVTFRVQIDNGVADGTTVFNRAVVNYVEDTLGGRDVSTGDVTTAVVGVGTDLTIAKQDDVDPVFAGQNVTYTLDVSNDGPEDAADVLVSDVLPLGTTFVSATAPSGWTTTDPGVGNNGTVRFARSTFANGASAQFTVTVQVDGNLADGTVLNNTATIASTTPDVNTGNNDADEQTTVQQFADLSLTKSVSPASVNVGGTATFTINVTNDGPADATGVIVEDALPAGVTFVSANSLDYNETNELWSIGTLASGATASLDITVTVDQAGALSNVAEVIASDQPDPDSSPNNSNPNEDDQASATVTGQQADLSLQKIVDNTTPTVGDNVTFTLTLLNDGPSTATGVEVTDQLPSGLAFVSANPSNAYDDNSGVWTVGSVAAGTQAVLELVAEVTVANTQLSNGAQVTASDQPDPDSTPGNNDPGEDDQTAATVTGQVIDLELEKTVMPTPIRVGETTTYTIKVRNNGTIDATGVEVTDVLPSGLTLISSMTPDGSYAAGLWTVGTISPNDEAMLMLEVRADQAGTFVNSAEVSAANEPDANSTPGNNVPSEDDQDSATFDATPLADLSLTKVVDNPAQVVGQNVTFTVTVTNDGPSDATGIEITDALPVGLDFVSSNPSAGTFANDVWSIATLASGASATLNIVATVTGDGPFVNTAELTAVNEEDPDSTPNNGDLSEDDLASASVGGTRADLSLTKTASAPDVNVGSAVTFTLEVTNSGSADATGVEVTDQLPQGLTFVSANPANAYDANSGLWTVGNVAINATETLEIVATVTGAGPFVNSAEVTAQDQPDVDSAPNNNDPQEDDQDTATVSGIEADLALTKVADPMTGINVGDLVSFIITVTNNGSSDATGVEVTDQLPPSVEFVAANATSGIFDDVSGLWTIGSIPAGEAPTLTIVVKILTQGTISNTAEVSASDQPDPNSTPGNNDPNEDDQDTATIGATGVADLSLDKVVDNPMPDEGDIVTFSVTVTNDGPNGASGVVVDDVLPVGLEFQAFVQQPGGATYDANTRTITWTVRDFGFPGCPSATCFPTTYTLIYTALVDTDQPVENFAEVVASDQNDPDSTPGDGMGDDSDSAAVTPNDSSGGGGGGVESDGNMASKLAQRLFHRRADAQQRRALRAEAAPSPLIVGQSSAAFATASKSGSAALNLADYVPASGPQQSAAVITTPTDLLGITNASSVFAADYLRPDGRRLGAIFGTTTPEGSLYDHTKNTCDRLAGGRLDDVRLIDVDGRTFVLSKLIHSSGEVDYAVSFNAYQTSSGFVIDSRFAPDTYEVPAGTREVLSLQVWSAAPVFTETLVADVLAKLDADASVTFLNEGATAPGLPSVYVHSGSYQNGVLTLRVANTTGRPQVIELTGSTTSTESEAQAISRTDFVRTLSVPAPAGDADSPVVDVTVETGYLFDAAFAIEVDGETLDRVYWSDGPWGISAGNATIQSFETYSQDERTVEPGTFQVERSAYIGGAVTDYAALFRYLRPNAQPVDLSAYSHIEFTAYGQGTVQFFAEKASVDNGDHYGATFRLGTSPKAFRFALADLAKIGGTTGFTAEDVTALVFYLNGNGQAASSFDFVLEDVRFTGAASSVATEEIEVPEAMTLEQNYPNPFNPVTTIGFAVPRAQQVTLAVYDVLGRRVQVLVDGVLSAGRHEALFEAATLPSGTYIYRLETAGQALTKTLTLMK
ncbi:MAG: T9SS type A sorting domain-containing protein [Bacteroidota bacterium]